MKLFQVKSNLQTVSFLLQNHYQQRTKYFTNYTQMSTTNQQIQKIIIKANCQPFLKTLVHKQLIIIIKKKGKFERLNCKNI